MTLPTKVDKSSQLDDARWKTEYLRRLNAFIEISTARKVAAVLGVSTQAIRAHTKGTAYLNTRQLALLQLHLSLNIEYLITGD